MSKWSSLQQEKRRLSQAIWIVWREKLNGTLGIKIYLFDLIYTSSLATLGKG